MYDIKNNMQHFRQDPIYSLDNATHVHVKSETSVGIWVWVMLWLVSLDLERKASFWFLLQLAVSYFIIFILAINLWYWNSQVVERKNDRRAELQKKREQEAARIDALNAAKQKAAEVIYLYFFSYNKSDL